MQEPYLTHIPLSSFCNTHQWHIGILVCLSPEQMQSFPQGNHTLKNGEVYIQLVSRRKFLSTVFF